MSRLLSTVLFSWLAFCPAIALSAPAGPSETQAGVHLAPAFLHLREGRTEARLMLHVRDRQGRPSGSDGVIFRSSDPDVVSVNADGTVVATGFGDAVISAEVPGVPGIGRTEVRAGHVSLLPPVLILAPDGEHASGAVSVEARNADGSPYELPPGSEFVCDHGCGPAASVSLSAAGTVTAQRPLGGTDPLPRIRLRAGGEFRGNSARVIVLDGDVSGLQPREFGGARVAFYTPRRVVDQRVARMWREFDVVRVTDLAFDLLEELTGVAPRSGSRRLFIINGITFARDGYRCGFAENPVWIGTQVLGGRSVARRSCFVNPRQDEPGWGVFFHEMGHLAGSTRRLTEAFAMTTDPDDGTLSDYGEGLAQVGVLFVTRMLQERQERYGLSDATIDSILRHWGTEVLEPTDALDDYVGAGANFAELNAGVVTDIFKVLERARGTGVLYRFFSTLLPAHESFSFTVLTAAERATFHAAALSAATGVDLRSRFEEEWGFPVADPLYEEMLEELRVAATLRDPAVHAGRDRDVDVAEVVDLGRGASTVDWEGDELQVLWRVVERPDGSEARIRHPRTLEAAFRPDVPGRYILRLEASDDLVTGFDEVRIDAGGQR